MSVPEIRTVELAGAPGDPVLLVGPSLGTAVTPLWETTAARLNGMRVVGWDLPGHGGSPDTAEPFTMAELAAGVLAATADLAAGERIGYAGVSVGGAIGLQLLLDAPERFAASALMCTGAKIADAGTWNERAATVKAFGTAATVDGSRQRWFAAGFAAREPERVEALLASLTACASDGYRFTCGALAAFDVRPRLGEIAAPVLTIAGAEDQPTPPASLALIADGVQHGHAVVLDGVAHLAPAESPERVARLLTAFFARVFNPRSGVPETATILDQRAAGMAVRRDVLGAAHVDRASAAATGFTQGFQDFITQYAWGGIWTRPGLDRRTRSFITLTALVARGHHEELAMHVRTAITNGVTVDELEELFLQTAIYCGVPDANNAFRIAQQTLREMGIDLGPA